MTADQSAGKYKPCMARNTRKMLTERTAALSSQWKELEPEFLRAKASLLAAKDRDDLYTSLVTEGSLDEAFDQAEEYGRIMAEAKKRPSPHRKRATLSSRTSWPRGLPTSRPTRS